VGVSRVGFRFEGISIMVEMSDALDDRQPERPLFFSGQMLTEGDLDSLVLWAQKKNRSAIAGRGWGVVKGLTVRRDLERSSRVVASEGLAIAGDGTMITFARADGIDLADSYKEASTTSNALRRASKIDGWGQMWAIDVGIRYKDRSHTEVPVRIRIGDDDAASTQPSRCSEEYELVPSLALDGGDETLDKWNTRFRNCSAVVSEFQQEFPQLDAARCKTWLNDRLVRHPIGELFAIEGKLAAPQERFADPNFIYPLLFEIVCDARLALLREPRDTTTEIVPLARVWLGKRLDGGEEQRPIVFGCDHAWPFRRSLRPATAPSKLGRTNLTSLFWAPAGEADALLAEQGFRMAYKDPFPLPENADDLNQLIEFETSSSAWDEQAVITVATDTDGERIIGVRAAHEAGATGLSLTLGDESTRPALPGSTLVLSYRVENTGRSRLFVTVEDALVDTGPPFSLDPRCSREFTRTYVVPSNCDEERIEAEVVATATLGSQAVKATANRTIEVLDTTPASISLEVKASGDVINAHDKMDYELTIINLGPSESEPLDVSLEIDRHDGVTRTWNLESRESKTVKLRYHVRNAIPGKDIRNRFSIRGVAQGERLTAASAVHDITVRRSTLIAIRVGRFKLKIPWFRAQARRPEETFEFLHVD
jgi:hypothetical protein